MPTAIEAVETGLNSIYSAGVGPVESMRAGYEAEIFGFESAGRRLVLRLFHYPSFDAKAEWEATVMGRLFEHGYPVPQVHLLRTSTQSPWSRPFVVMDRVDGESLAASFWGPPSETRSVARRELYRLMAMLHSLPGELVLPGIAVDPVASMRVRAREVGDASLVAAIERIGAVLEVAGPKPASVLHGDFHGGNVLRQSDGMCVVIDWSDAWVGDPRFDLAWTRLLCLGESEEDLKLYESFAGAEAGDLGPFEAFGAAKILTDVARAVLLGTSDLRQEEIDRMRSDPGFLRFVGGVLESRTGVSVEGLVETCLYSEAAIPDEDRP